MSYVSDSVWQTPSFGGLLTARTTRKAEKAKIKYIEERQPDGYAERKAEFNRLADEACHEASTKISGVTGEISELRTKMRKATSQGALAFMTARVDALMSLLDSYRLALSTTLQSLFMKFRDIVEYEEGLASFG